MSPSPQVHCNIT